MAGIFLLFTLGAARGVNLIQEFYLPMPEAQVLQGMETVSPAIADTNFFMVTSLLTTGDGTVIYYDQWEDGYETNLALPTQPSTQVWGDGNDANGICPGFTHDPVGIPAGTVITLSNTVPCKPRNPVQLYYDGSDRIAANKALVVTRAGWPSPTGPVNGGAVVVLSTLDYGTNFVSPIGQDMPEVLFSNVDFFVMASEDNTTVTIDLDGPGPTPPFSVTLNQGQSYFVDGGVKRGATITADKPLEANLACGDPINQYAYDWFTLYPQRAWAGSYYTPVPSMVSGGTLYTTINYFYNANATPITILYTNLTASGSFNVPANGGSKYPMPTNSGASFTSAGGETFTVLTTACADPTNDPTDDIDNAFNWGYTPLPQTSLTTVANVGWAPGSSDYTVNGSPVWVTPVANTLLYVAYGGTNNPLTDSAGNQYSTNYVLTALQSKRIYNPSTNNSQTGMKVYTLDGTLLSVAWGEDASTAPSGNPGLDLGTSVLPFPVPLLNKSSVIVTDVPPSGLSVGDTLQYSVETDNKSLLPLGNTVLIDTPSGSLQYVPNSTSLNGFPIPDTTNGFPLGPPNGYTIPVILSQGTSTFQYLSKVVGSTGVSNSVNIGGTSINATNALPAGYGAPSPGVLVTKSLISPSSGTAVVGQTMSFNLQVIDTGNTVLPNVMIADVFPTNNLSYLTASVPATATNLPVGSVTWTNLGSFAPGEETNITVYFTTIKTNALITNSATATSTNGLGGGATNSGFVTFKIAGVPAAGITVSKSLLSPVSGQAGVGSTVQYNLQVVNSGTLTLTNVQLVDNYPATNFSFVTSSILPTTNSAGKLTWTNIGTYAPGAFTNFTVTFTATNYTGKLTNYMVAGPPGVVSATNGVLLTMTPGAFTITKTVLSPSGGGSISIGSNIVFQILIQNTGRIPIRTIPLNDTYSGSYLQFLSATVPPSSTGGGDLYWTNLVGATPLAVNAILTNDITMEVIGGPATALNTAEADYGMDTNGAAIASASGSVSVNIQAAQITGTVYNDTNHSGTYNTGELPLENVTLSLYTVSNGMPVSLIESVLSDANGNYQLANLSTGAYLVAETLLPGYVGSAPPNNSVLVNFTSLYTTNINFFQYAISPTNLAVARGTVWNDVYGSGIYSTNDTGIANVEVDLLQDLMGNGIISPADPLVQSVFTGTNGAYTLGGIVPGNYIIREIVLSNYVNTGTAPLPITPGSGAVTNGNNFFNYYVGTGGTNIPPTAVPDFLTTIANLAATFTPLTNDYSPGNLPLVITNVAATNGIASIIGGTNIFFTPASNFIGTATIGYTVTNANGSSTTLITVTVLPSADIRIGKAAPASVFAVSNLVYTISVTNAGPAPATNVVITDPLPAGVTFVSASGGGTTNNGIATWSLGIMASNQVTNVTLTVTAPASGSLTNIATVGSPTPEPNPTNNVTPPVVTSITPLADLAIAKAGPLNVAAAGNFSYTISVTNFGPSAASSVVVTDALPAGLTFVSATANGTNFGGNVVWNLGTMAASQATNLTLTVIAPANGVSLTNTASVASPTGDTNLLNNTTPPVITSVTPAADVSIVKSGPVGALFNSSYSYTLTVSNAGPSAATGLIVTDSLPAGLVFVSSVPATTTNGLNQVIWNFGSFAANYSSNLTLNVGSTQRGSLTNLASLGSPVSDPVPANNTAPPVVTSVTNFPPLANPDTYSIAENTTNTLSPLVNDIVRTPGGTLTIIGVSPTNGTATVSGTNVIFTPTLDFLGTATIGYTITDGVGGTNTSLITVLVTNIPPLANPDSYSIAENTTNTLSPLVNDVLKTYGGTLSIIGVSPTNGTAAISGTNVIFTPPLNFLGTATIGYTITDGIGGTNSSLITVVVTNIPPQANPDSYSITENTTNTFSPLVNDVLRTSGGTLSIIGVSPTNGTAAISGTNVIFTPALNFHGTATIGYTITDGIGGTNSSLITVLVTNIPPLANPDSYSIAENTTNTLSPLVNDLVRTSGGVLSIVGVSPTNGTATISGTNVVFTPALNFLGTATIGYTITDGVGGTNSSLITVLVTNVPPLANPDSYAITENTTNTLSPLVNDIDRTPGGTLTIVGVSPTNGTATISGTNVIFKPTLNFLGTATIGYTISDGVGGTNSSLITILVTNIPPQANPDSYSISENTTNTLSPLANDVLKTPGGTLTIIAVSPTNGTATILGTNIIFTPTLNFLGTATIGYTITDGTGGTNSALITVQVTNVPPLANPDSYSTTENTTNTLSPLVNDVVRTSGGILSIIGVSPTNGTATISGTNVIFTPTLNFLGTATIGYTITDGVGGTNKALITVLVTNIPPLANPDAYSIAENTTNTLSPLVNDVVRTSGGMLSIIGVSPTNGTATISGTNVIFTPTLDFRGTATIGYTITDGIGGTNSSVITVLVTNIPPLANPDSYSIAENTTNTLSPLVNDILQTPGGTLTLISVSPTNGTATILGTNITFTPTLNFRGTATIGYTITDGIGGTNSSLITVLVTNVPPVANPDSYAIAENTTNTLSPLVNDALKTPGGTLIIIGVSPTNGTATISGTNVIFTPTLNFLGTATIGYTVTDGIGGTNSSLITVLVTNVPPLAIPDSYSIAENTTNTLSPLVNDVLNTPGGTLSIIGVSPTNGTATVSGTNVIFIPTLNFLGTASIGYTITDGIGGTNSSVITLLVSNVPPVANPDNYSIAENTTNTLSPLVNDIVRTPGGVLSIISVSPTNGIATISGTNVIFIPTLNFVGTVTIGYTITDGIGGTNSSLITVLVTNIPPLANPDSYAIAENTTNTLNPLVNDVVRTSGGVLSIIGVSPTNGTATISGTNVVFTPALNFLGTATIGYTITDGVGGTNSSLITVVVTNVPPLANPDSYSIAENTTNTLSPLVNDVVHTPGGTLTIIGVSPTNGTATISGTNLVFTPTLNFLGAATIGYTITDGIGGTNSSLITVLVTNVPPVANPDSYSIVENTTNTLSPLVNDSLETPGGTLSIIGIWPTNGTASISGTNVIFTPTLNFLGTATIGYTITDGVGGTNSSLVTVVVTNVPPLANPDNYLIAENTTNTLSPLVNDVLKTPGGALSIIGVSPTNGTATISGTNVIFTPTLNFLGTATIGYTITDGIGGTNSSIITVLVTNIPPMANPDSYSIEENTTNTLSPLVNDVVRTSSGMLSIIGVSPTNGTAIISGTNVIFTPTLNFLGTATIGYTITDGIGGTNSSVISVVVTNIPPLANPDSYSVTENTTNTLSPLVNDIVRTPGGLLSIIGVSPTNGTATISGTNVIFTPTLDFLGTATIGYTITDGIGGTNSSVITVLVSNIPPVANPDAYSITENTTNIFAVLTNDVVVTTGGTLQITSATATNGAVTILGGTNLSYIPGTNFLGTNVINYTVTDGIGGTNSTYVTVIVTNIPPLANPDNYSITENTTNTLSPLVNDSLQTPGGTLSVISVSPTNGTAIISGTNVIFTPTLNFLGTATIGYTITDGIGGTNSSLITILVTNVPPLANPDSYSIAENTTNILSPLVNDVLKTPGGTLSIIGVSPTNGTATILGTNIVFTPTLNFLGTATIGYTIIDGIGGTNTSLITVLVTNVPPLANPDNYSVTENTTNTLSPLVNDVLKTPGGVLSITTVSPTNGTATISGTNVIFTPTLNFLGTATIGYTITDGIGGTSSSVITVLVTNLPPIANPDSYTMAENGTNTVAPLVNDVVRTTGGVLSIIGVAPTNGVANILNGTNVMFIPTTGFVGIANIGYTITDGLGGTNSSVISISVTNQLPIALPQSLSTTENTALPVTLTGFDPAAGALTFIIVNSPAHGTLTGLNTNTGAVTYTPTNNFTGTDSFMFRVNNSYNNSSNATITIAVTPIADLLVQQSGPVSGIAGSNLVFTVAVTNLGPAGATNIVVTNQIDSNWTFVSASAGGSTNGNLVTWTIPFLPANGKTNLTVTLFAVEGGVLTNIASGISITPDLDSTNNNGSLTNAQVVTAVSALADVAVFKSGDTNVLAGGTANYTILATNAGPSTASNVVVFDKLPAGATLQTASGNYTVSNNFVVWDPATLPGGTSTNFTVALTAPAAGTMTNLAFSVSPTPDPSTNNNNGTSSNSIARTPVTPVADLAVGKSGVAAGVLNSNFSYTISVTNFGPSSTANFAVTDSLPAGIVFVSSVPATTTNTANQVIWINPGPFAANATTNYTLTVKAVTRAVFTNIATVGGPTLDPTPTNNVSPPVITSITNRPPVAANDSASTARQVAVTIPVLANDSDPDGDTITIVSVAPTNGIAVISGTNIVFTPTNATPGTDIFGYTITDGFGGTNSALVFVSVTNRPPVAANDSASTARQVAVTIPVLTNDSDPDGDTITIVSVAPTNGTAVISGTNIVFTPTNAAPGTDIFGYTITDGFGGTNSTLVFVTVTNRPPVAVNDSAITARHLAVTIPVLANDSDPDGDTLTIISVAPTNGIAVISTTNIIFTPTNAAPGTDIFGYTITDGFGGTNYALVFVTVTNRPPVAVNDSASTARQVPVTIPVLVNDSDPDGDMLTIVSVAPTNGVAVISGTNIVFTPTNTLPGTDVFGYTISDGFGGTNSALVTVTVTNRPPVANNQNDSTTYNTAVNITLTGSDPDSDPITYVIVTQPVGGVLSGVNTNTGAVTYTPTNNFSGVDTFTFLVNDGMANSTNATVSITVGNPVMADLAVFKSGPTNGVAGSNLVYTITVTNLGPNSATNVLVQDDLPAGFSLVGATPAGATLVSNVVNWPAFNLAVHARTNFTVTALSIEGGVFTNFATAMSDAVDTNTVNNNGTSTNSQVVTSVSALADVAVFKSGDTNVLAGGTANYTILATNAGPSTASNVVVFDKLPAGATLQTASGNYTVSNNFVVWDAATLPGGAATNFTVALTAPASGAITNVAFSVSATPDPGTNNNNGTSSNSIAHTTVTPVADLAVGKSGVAAGVLNSNFSYTISVTNFGPSSTANFVVTDSLPAGIVFVSSLPSATTNVVNQVIWTNSATLAANAATNYTLTVKAVLRAVFTNIATIGGPTLDPTPTNNTSVPVVTGITNRPPVAVNDSASTARQMPVTIPVLANDSDPDGDPLTIVSIAPTNGIAVISGTNILFTPTNATPGTDIFGYTITDGFGGTNSALVFVTVTNRPPVAVNDSASAARQVAVTIPVLANDSDPDGDTLTIVSIAPTNGIAVISGTNIVFTPTNATPGTDVFGYTITDGFGGTNSALVFVTVTNRPPVAMNDSASTARHLAVTIPVLANDSDPDGDTLTIVSVAPTNGIAVISGTNIVFTPTNATPGTDIFGYTITDGFGGTNSALVFVTVTNRPPVAVNDFASTPKNVAVTIPVLANDSDPDGDPLTIVSVAPTNGTAVINGTNIVFTPATNFTGTATAGYIITDGFGGTNSALVFVTVTNRPPVANSQGVSTTYNTAVNITLTGSDPDNDPITFVLVTPPAGGVLTGVNTNTGAVTYTPTNNFSGVDTFTFLVNDGTANSTNATVTITVGNPVMADLAVFKAGPTNGFAGSNLVYTITVTNLGPNNATNVLVQDDLPAGFSLVGATPVGATLVSNIVNWPAFNLAAHARTNFTVTALSLDGGVFTNLATATSDAVDTNAVNNNGTSTNSQVRTTVSALADVQVFKTGGTNVMAGAILNYTITATNAGPSTASNVVVQDQLPAGSTFQSAGGSYTMTNNIVYWTAMTLTNGASVNFSIALTAPASGTFTNIALSTSPTPDPNPTNNNGTLGKSRVSTKVVPAADLFVLVFGPANAVVGSNFVYSLIVSNAGPDISSNVVASDALPVGFDFVSASSGGKDTNGIVTWPLINALAVGAVSNYTITVNSPLVGSFTNAASAISSTFDPNPTNNTGVLPSAKVLTQISFAQFAWLAGAPVFNPQTGLYEETVTITNTGNGTVAGFQLYVNMLTPKVYLWNATGTNGGTPYVQYSFPLDPSNSVAMILEFYDPNRIVFSNTLSIVPVIPANNTNAATNGSVAVSTVFTDNRSGTTRFVIEFASVPGSTYTIIYSDDLVTWKVATPSVTASANVTQWYDDGPPKTDAEPASVGSRFYRIIKNN